MKKLKEECGVTIVSLENLALLVPFHGSVRFIVHVAPFGSAMDDSTLIVFRDGYRHVATGFSSGYRGEGPHGLLTTIKTYLKRDDITIKHICKWRGYNYMILPGKGRGDFIHFFAGHEIW